MHLNLHLLRIFYTVATRQSFSRASEDLYVSQPAVSKAVRELENLLGLPLIERGAGGPRGVRGVRLTESGAALFDHARGIFALERAAVEDIDLRIKLRRGTLTLGASTTIASYWLPPCLARFAADFPFAAPRVVVGNTHEIVEQLLDCRVDVALVEGTVDDARIQVDHWRDDEMMIAIAPTLVPPVDQPERLNWLRSQRWIVREEGSGTRDAVRGHLASLGIEIVDVLEVGSNEAIARMVAGGVGIAMLPKVVIEDLVLLDRLKVLSVHPDVCLLRPLYRLVLRDRPRSPLAAAFESILTRLGRDGQ